MSSSNYRRNKAFIDQFRKELKAEMDDLSEVDVKVLNQAVNEGVRWLKERTPTGIHPNPVTFKVKSGPKAGKVVSFKTRIPLWAVCSKIMEICSCFKKRIRRKEGIGQHGGVCFLLELWASYCTAQRRTDERLCERYVFVGKGCLLYRQASCCVV